MPKKKDAVPAADPKANNAARAMLRDCVKKIEMFHDEKANIEADIAGQYRDLKDHGFNTKAIRKLVRLRAMDPAERREEETIIALYEEAMGG